MKCARLNENIVCNISILSLRIKCTRTHNRESTKQRKRPRVRSIRSRVVGTSTLTRGASKSRNWRKKVARRKKIEKLNYSETEKVTEKKKHFLISRRYLFFLFSVLAIFESVRPRNSRWKHPAYRTARSSSLCRPIKSTVSLPSPEKKSVNVPTH